MITLGAWGEIIPNYHSGNFFLIFFEKKCFFGLLFVVSMISYRHTPPRNWGPRRPNSRLFFCSEGFCMNNGRVHVYVDGFNLYYGLKDTQKKQLYWLDIRAFIESFLAKEGFYSLDIDYFTAKPLVNIGKIERHAIYCQALKSTGINVVYGQYKAKEIICRNCGAHIKSYEEKETDVNIALRLVSDAADKKFDTAILFSGDSDLAPAVDLAIKLGGKVLIFFPLNRNRSKRLKNTAATCLSFYENRYKRNQFPNRIQLSDHEWIERPARWNI
jgi:uncharacterized LabA/DUF88 family protein